MQAPIYYSIQNYPQPMMDTTGVSNDSGLDAGMFNQGYPTTAQVQYYPQYQPPVPMFYAATSPLPQTPQIAQVAPVFTMASVASTGPVATVAPQQIVETSDGSDDKSADQNA
jgi:hypothetical protein